MDKPDIRELVKERILVLDGAMGTMIQRHKLEEEDFRKVVFLNDNGIAKRVEVETGISDNTHIQILSGIREGDEVVTGNYRVLSRELQKDDKIKVSGESVSPDA